MNYFVNFNKFKQLNASVQDALNGINNNFDGNK